MIDLLRNKKSECKRISTDTNGRIMKRGTHTNDEAFSLINLRNSNTEVEHTKTLCELDQMLGKFI